MIIKAGRILAFLCALIMHLSVTGQDSVGFDWKDSSRVYRKIQNYSNKRGLTRLIYPVFFKSAPAELQDIIEGHDNTGLISAYLECENKIIRSVRVEVLDPFGYRVSDSAGKPVDRVAKTGNYLHVKTLPLAVKNLLLFRRHQAFDSLSVMESLRLLRKQSYVREVYMELAVVNDSINVLLKIQDVWSIVPDGALSGNQLSLSLKEQNFLGSGHQLRVEQMRNLDIFRTWYDVGYQIPNVYNTFISAQLRYSQSENGGYNKYIHIDRPFYSTYTQWAGGLSLEQKYGRDSLLLTSGKFLQDYRFNTQDYWVGNSIPVFRGTSEVERNTHLILSNRWIKKRFFEKPSETIDTSFRYADESLYLLGISLNSRKYIQDRFLFRYGFIEDIPIGRSYTVLAGIRNRNSVVSYYLGYKSLWADYYNFGYLAFRFELGTFYTGLKRQEGSLLAGSTYFTKLRKIGNWKFRQFVKSEFVMGFNRLPLESISFNSYMGSSGFDQEAQMSTAKWILSFQTQSYAPWSVIGFRFGPYLLGSLGMMSDANGSFKGRKLYTHLGIGVLVKNDFLNASFLQISLSYYPVIPSQGNNVIKMNTFNTRDFGLKEFETGKPEIVEFN